MDNFLFKRSFTDSLLPKLIESAKNSIQRNVELFAKTEDEAREKALSNIFANWDKERLLIHFSLHKGIENIEVPEPTSDITEMMRQSLNQLVEICVIENKSIEDVVSNLSYSQVSINFPTKDDDLTKKTKEELKQIVSIIREDSFATRALSALKSELRPDIRGKTLESYISQILVEENLPLIIERNNSRRSAQKTIAKNRVSGSQTKAQDVFDGSSPRKVFDIHLDYLARRRNPQELITVLLVA